MKKLMAVGAINARLLFRRAGNLAVALFGFAAVMFVLSIALGTQQGLTDLSDHAVDERALIVFRSGAPAETMSTITREDLLQIQANLRGAGVAGLLSAEAVVPVNVSERGSQRGANIYLRGLEQPGARLHGGTLVRGHWPAPGSNEIVVGHRAAQQYEGLELNRTIRWGRQLWTVAGVFDAGGAMEDGEAWGNLEVIQNAYGRGASVQSMHFEYPGKLELAALKKVMTTGLQSDIDVKSRRDYFSGQMQFLTAYVRAGIVALGVYMAACVLLGTSSIMDSILQPRIAQYKTLHSIGFGKLVILVAVALEGALIGLIGGLTGVAIAYFVFNSMQLSTSAMASQIVFVVHMTAAACAKLLALSVALGGLGAFSAAVGLSRWRSALKLV